jgi:hypothetical protein
VAIVRNREVIDQRICEPLEPLALPEVLENPPRESMSGWYWRRPFTPWLVVAEKSLDAKVTGLGDSEFRVPGIYSGRPYV